jgi:hypothetical protein
VSEDVSHAETGIGPLTVTWGVNGWVLVDATGRTDQRQVTSRHELADLLAGLGMTRAEAETEARSLWSTRPGDAAAETSRPYQELWRDRSPGVGGRHDPARRGRALRAVSRG